MSTPVDLVPDGTAPPGCSLALPWAVVRTDALVAPPAHDADADDVVRLRAELGRDLLALSADLPRGRGVRLDAYTLRVARAHPERCMVPDEPFRPSPRACRRAVGVAAVGRCVRGLAAAPARAVADVLGAAAEDVTAGPGAGGVPWWAAWYAQLPAAGRAVVQAEATAWATQLFHALAWSRLPRPTVVGGRDDWWQCPGGGQVVLQGRADVRVLVESRPALFVLGPGRCPVDWRTELGFPGLVATLARPGPSAPCRVMGYWPASGQVRVLDLDGASLAATATAVVAAVATWVDGRLEAAGGGPR